MISEFVPTVSLMGFTLSSDSTVTLIVFGYSTLIGTLGWLWRISLKHAKYVEEHELLKVESAKHAAQIVSVDEASKSRDAAVQASLDEVKSMMREERHQMGRMASKIDLLISVLVNRQDATVNLEQIMAILEKGDAK